MNTNCPCGGRLRRTDIVLDWATGLYRDCDPLVAHWRCAQCGRTREQRKRQSKADTKLVSQPIWE